ncbi:hypothetical protein PgNI_05194 [Pyricularia grisea]|uniref:Uncharacterized protein n=1 Tax=Pyricularia grisea TaxID=148305 RepID=A0A6P8B7U0_PYRGI|nr:hypothetical protein PgNI_05194 [Pyricularia grisea]TLD11345.1 hypothetical protein PgNI_05194 [Pyricularia grisea]
MQFSTLLKFAMAFAVTANALPTGCKIHNRDILQLSEARSVGKANEAQLEKRRDAEPQFACGSCGKKWHTQSEADSCPSYHRKVTAFVSD